MTVEKDVLVVEPPNSELAIRKAVEIEQRRHHVWFEQQSKRIEKERDRNLKQLDQAVDLFCKEFGAQALAVDAGKRAKRRKRASQSTPAQTEARLKAVFRFLLDSGKPRSSGDVRRALNLTHDQVRRLLLRLTADGMVLRSGKGSSTKYEAKPGKPNRMELANMAAASTDLPLGARMLKAIKAKGETTPDELARELRIPFEHVQRSCEELIRDDAIVVDIRGGRRVYAAQTAV